MLIILTRFIPKPLLLVLVRSFESAECNVRCTESISR
jgi:hypothetical protein